MAGRVWNSSSSTDGNDPANYTGAGALAGEDLLFDATSVVNCTLSAALTGIASATTVAGYTGAFNLNGKELDSNGTISFDHVGALTGSTAGSILRCRGGAMHIGSGVGTIDMSRCQLRLHGTVSLDIDKAMFFLDTEIAASATVAMEGSAGNVRLSYLLDDYTAGLTIGANAAFSNSQQCWVNASVSFTGSQWFPWIVATGAAWTGAGGVYFNSAGTGWNINILDPKASTHTGIWSNQGGVGTYRLQENVNLAACTAFEISMNNTVAVSVWSPGTYTLTCKKFCLYRSAMTGTGSLTANMGSSTTNCTAFINQDPYGNINSGPVTLNLSDATINCAGNLTLAASWTVNTAGTSVTSITNTSTVTLAGKHLYSLTLNAPSKTIAIYDDLIVDRDFSVTDGTTWNIQNKIISIGRNALFGGTSNWTGASVTVAGTICTFDAATVLTYDVNAVLILTNIAVTLTTNGVSIPRVISAVVDLPEETVVLDPTSGGPAEYGTLSPRLTGRYRAIASASKILNDTYYGVDAAVQGDLIATRATITVT